MNIVCYANMQIARKESLWGRSIDLRMRYKIMTLKTQDRLVVM